MRQLRLKSICRFFLTAYVVPYEIYMEIHTLRSIYRFCDNLNDLSHYFTHSDVALRVCISLIQYVQLCMAACGCGCTSAWQWQLPVPMTFATVHDTAKGAAGVAAAAATVSRQTKAFLLPIFKKANPTAPAVLRTKALLHLLESSQISRCWESKWFYLCDCGSTMRNKSQLVCKFHHAQTYVPGWT